MMRESIDVKKVMTQHTVSRYCVTSEKVPVYPSSDRAVASARPRDTATAETA